MPNSTEGRVEDGVGQRTSFISSYPVKIKESVEDILENELEANEKCDRNINKKEYKFFGWTQHIPARVVLGIVSFFGFCTNYMLRVNLNIAIVAMVKNNYNNPTLSNSTLASEEEACFTRIINDSKGSDNNATFEFFNSTDNQEEVFSWNIMQQGLVLGSFYWSYIVSVVPGAILANIFGAKLVFGASNGITAVLALIIPFAARTGLPFLIVVRVLQGFASGTSWPAMHTMASQWIPPHERSKFVSTYLGNAVGTAVTYPLCGLLINHYGWTAAFYVPGCITLVWCLFWWLFAFETPNVHPRITLEEKLYIENAVSPTLNKAKLAIPWMEIFKSAPFWAVVWGNLGSLWAFMTVLTYAPTYLKNVLGYNIQANGALSGLPNIMRFIFGVTFSYITDRLIQAKTFSFTIIRKAATLTAVFFPGLLYLLMTNVGCNAAAEIAILTTAAALGGATSSGPLANTMDLAPNFAGMIMSLVNLVSMSTGFLVPSIVSAVVKNNNSREEWRRVFIIGTCMSTLCSTIYVIFGSGEVQPWNGSDEKKKLDNTEREYSKVPQQDIQDASNGSTTPNGTTKRRDSINKTEEKSLEISHDIS